MTKHVSLVLGVLVLVSLFISQSADAVAFKMKNDSKYTLRARCYDRGKWRQWVTFSPGGWGDFAPSVKRREHSIQIQVWWNGQWQQLYYNNHGSRMFTRVVQAFNDQQGRIYFAWWDEPPGCRDAPPYPGSGYGTCLKPSGWLKDRIWDYARKAGTAYIIGQ